MWSISSPGALSRREEKIVIEGDQGVEYVSTLKDSSADSRKGAPSSTFGLRGNREKTQPAGEFAIPYDAGTKKIKPVKDKSVVR